MDIATAITELLTEHAALTQQDRREVMHFVGHGEYGLAHQTWADIVREEDREIPVSVRASAILLAQQMGIDPDRLFDAPGVGSPHRYFSCLK